jgi:hypothetical protein
MADEHLATYLNDHLAGSIVALQLLEHLETLHRGTEVGRLVAGLRADVDADRRELESLMRRLNVAESRTRKAAAWLSEKMSEIKLRMDDAPLGDLNQLEAFELLALGIEGKLSLWRSLSAAAEESPALRVADYDGLLRRAEDQRGRAESARIAAARRALRPELSEAAP